MSGTLNRFGDTYLLALQLVDAKTSKVLHEGSVRFANEAGVLEAVAAAVRQLFPDALAATSDAVATTTSMWEAEAPEPAPSGHSRWPSILLGVAGVACGAVAIAGLVDVLGYQSASSTSGQLTYAQAQSGLRSANTWQVASIVLGVAAVGLATTAVVVW